MLGKYELQPTMVQHVLASIRVDKLRGMVKTLHKLTEHQTGKHIEKPRMGQPASHRKGDVVDWLAGVITQPQTSRFVYRQRTADQRQRT